MCTSFLSGSLGIGLVAALAGCGGGGGASPPPTELPLVGEFVPGTPLDLVGAPGSPLEGFRLSLPADALSTPVSITAVRAAAVEPSGNRTAVGLAVQLGPAGLRFDRPATLELPFDRFATLGALAGLTDLEFTRCTAGGSCSVLSASGADGVGATVQVNIDGFSTYWPSVETPLPAAPDRIRFGEYFPTERGDRWFFEGGIRVEIEDIVGSNLTDPEAFGIYTYLGADRRGSYQVRGPQGGLIQLGFGEEAALSFEELHRPTVVAPGELVNGGLVRDRDVAYEGFIPIGDPTVAYTGSFTGETQLTRIFTQLNTPIARFSDIVQYIRLTEWEDTRFGSGMDAENIFFARGVGPVVLAVDGEFLALVGGEVRGIVF